MDILGEVLQAGNAARRRRQRAIWGTDKLVDGWLALAVLAAVFWVDFKRL